MQVIDSPIWVFLFHLHLDHGWLESSFHIYVFSSILQGPFLWLLLILFLNMWLVIFIRNFEINGKYVSIMKK